MNKDWIRGKTVVISGAGNGLGKYLSYNLITMYNCRVIGVDIDEVSLSNLKTKLNEIGEDFEYFSFDAKNESNWLNFSSIIESEKIQVDILINCIGQSPKFNSFNKITHKETTQTMATNLYSCIFSIKALYNNIKKSRTPSIINLCCASVNIAMPGASVYSASKSALKCYTEVLQQELEGFYVGLFILGMIKTNFWNKQNEFVQTKFKQKAMTPQQATEKIIKSIIKKNTRAVIGKDAIISDKLVRWMPKRAQALFNSYLKRHKYRFEDLKEDAEGQ